MRLRMVVLNGLLLGALGGAILAVQVGDRGAAGVDASVRRYAMAVSSGELEAAVAEIAPAERARWRDWIAGQLGNVYDVRGVAVHARPLLQGGGRPADVTVVLDVDRDYPDEYYQPTTRVPVEQVDGRWYLAEPLIAPEALASS